MVDGNVLTAIVVPIAGLAALWLNQRHEFRKAKLAAAAAAESLAEKVATESVKKDEQLKVIHDLANSRLTDTDNKLTEALEKITELKETAARSNAPIEDAIKKVDERLTGVDAELHKIKHSLTGVENRMKMAEGLVALIEKEKAPQVEPPGAP